MKKSIFELAALVGLAAVSATLFSCSTKVETTVLTSSNVRVSVRTFDIGQTDYASGVSTRADANDPFKRLAFKVFDSDGKAVYETTQCYTDEGFGNVSFLLPEGTYTFVAVGHNVSTGVTDATVVADIASALVATLPEQNIVDVFCATKQVTVLPAQDLQFSMSLPRVNSKFKLVMTDAIPLDASTMEFVLNESGSESTAAHSIDPSSGFATANRQYVRTFDVSGNTGISNQSISINLLLTGATQDIDVLVTAFDANGDVIIARNIDAVPMSQNRITTATGVFFNSETGGSISVNSTWDTGASITY